METQKATTKEHGRSKPSGVINKPTFKNTGKRKNLRPYRVQPEELHNYARYASEWGTGYLKSGYQGTVAELENRKTQLKVQLQKGTEMRCVRRRTRVLGSHTDSDCNIVPVNPDCTFYPVVPAYTLARNCTRGMPSEELFNYTRLVSKSSTDLQRRKQKKAKHLNTKRRIVDSNTDPHYEGISTDSTNDGHLLDSISAWLRNTYIR